ncbi:Imidazoleglycerol-phosphate dehydratase, chloroplastic [Sesamum angolense]|uniref:Imidazoleglycerol-phosphate dehydratase, chloroplastic n=1 Tax=Sesamum angolense TaxID=2727404 RepID=A0AAE2BKC8_9LAMI|nr:Imidazoleglycerol-phosphate dehydratase, chloroplastic [Sesamum angolense]
MKDLDEDSYIIGFKIFQDRSKTVLGITQTSYVEKIVKRFEIEDSTQGFIRMRHNVKHSKTQYPKTDEEFRKMFDVSLDASFQFEVDDVKSQPGFIFRLNGVHFTSNVPHLIGCFPLPRKRRHRRHRRRRRLATLIPPLMEPSNPSTAHSSLPQFCFINSGIHFFNDPAKNSGIYSCYGGRIGEAKIVTIKTNVFAKINLDGRAVSETDTGISFLDYSLDVGMRHIIPSAITLTWYSYLVFDVCVKAIGDMKFDDYRRTEGVGKAIGTALLKALGDNKVIKVCGDFSAVHDEALVQVSVGEPHRYKLIDGEPLFVDISGGAFLSVLSQYLWNDTTHKTACWDEFSHIIEATFKAFAKALRQATDYETRRGGSVPRFVFGSLIKILNRIMAPNIGKMLIDHSAQMVSSDGLDTSSVMLKVGCLGNRTYNPASYPWIVEFFVLQL